VKASGTFKNYKNGWIKNIFGRVLQLADQ
jgi:hypothetical protein